MTGSLRIWISTSWLPVFLQTFPYVQNSYPTFRSPFKYNASSVCLLSYSFSTRTLGTYICKSEIHRRDHLEHLVRPPVYWKQLHQALNLQEGLVRLAFRKIFNLILKSFNVVNHCINVSIDHVDILFQGLSETPFIR